MEKELYNNINCVIFGKNINNEITFVNESFKNMFNINNIDYKANQELFSKLINLKSSEILNLNQKIYKSIKISKEDDYEEMIYMLVDVCDVKEKYEVNNDKNILKTVIDNIPELIFYKDKDLRYVGLNKACEKFYQDKGVYNIIGKNDLELPLERKFIETCYRHDNQILKEGKTLYIEEEGPREGSDEPIYFQTIKTPIVNEAGELEGLVGIVLDITEHKNIEKKLREISYLDKLTQLYNRAYFDVYIKQLSEERQFPIGIITGDINGLKIVNDTFGHIEGDKLLISIANILQKASNDKGVVFRWGGDEFVTIIPNASKSICEKYIKKVKNICSKSTYEHFQLSIAQGYVLLKENEKIDDALKESEDKLYREKIIQNKSVRTSIISTLNKNLQNKDIETEGHTERVVENCRKIGKVLNLDSETLEKLLLVGRLHDIGKTAIPEEILLKPDKLTKEEYEIMKTHSEKGYRLALLLPEISHIARGILTHHERWDGKGYPLGIEGEEIPLVARIVSVVDAFDAMTNNRIYSIAKSREEAIGEIINCSGTQFDPTIVNVFLNIINKESVLA